MLSSHSTTRNLAQSIKRLNLKDTFLKMKEMLENADLTTSINEYSIKCKNLS